MTPALPYPPAQQKTDWDRQPRCPKPSALGTGKGRSPSCSASSSPRTLVQEVGASVRARPQAGGGGVSQTMASSGTAAVPHRQGLRPGPARPLPAAARWRWPRPARAGGVGALSERREAAVSAVGRRAAAVRRSRAAAAGRAGNELYAPGPLPGCYHGALREFPAQPRGSGF